MENSKVFASNDYKEKLDSLASDIIKFSQAEDNEATIASYFETRLYDLIKTKFNVDISFLKEVSRKDFLSHKFKGRSDAVSNNLLIEYKRPSTLSRANHKVVIKDQKQILNYLMQLKDEGKIYDGILTDGVEYIYYYYNNGKFTQTSIKYLDKNALDLMIRAILNVGKKRLIRQNLINDFGNGSELVKLQCALYDQLKDTKDVKSNMLFEEWMSMYHLSENDTGKSDTLKERRDALSKAINQTLQSNNEEYKALFALETGYAIIVKIFALKSIVKINIDSDVQYFEDLLNVSLNKLKGDFKDIENGYVYNTNNITNLLEEDFFSWYTEDSIWNTPIAEHIQRLIGIVNDYVDATLTYRVETADLFREIYMLTIPGDVRKAFGEFFTPDWLADNGVENSIKFVQNPNWKFLDPTCGSGTFLLRAIHKIIDTDEKLDKDKDEILSDILNRVIGIDLNPLSVLAARVSYLYAIRPYISEDTGRIEIPVYLGDSAKLPEIVEDMHNNKYAKYTVFTQKGEIQAVFPEEFIKDSRFLPTINRWQVLINSGDKKLLSKSMSKVFKEKEDPIVKKWINNLSEKLIELNKAHWDGIWLRIVSNFLLLDRIKNVDIICGNPPWVKWENLPQEYASEIKHIAHDINLFSGKSYGLGGGINLNLAALISNVVGDKWLKQDGILTFLMPDTLLNSDSYEGWRKFEIKSGGRMYLNSVIDWSQADHPFKPVTDKFLTYFISKKKIDHSPTLIKFKKHFPKKIKISDVNNCDSWNEAKKYFIEEKGKLVKLSDSSNRLSRFYNVTQKEVDALALLYGRNDYKARQGVELTPREVYIFKKNKEGKYSNLQLKNTKIKAIPVVNVELEDAIMRPLLQSRNIMPFNIDTSNIEYGLIPYDFNQVIYNEEDLVDKFPKASEYLFKQKSRISKQSERSKLMARGEEFYALSKLGPYSTFKYAVAFRDNTNMKACFIDNTGKIKYFPVKHAPYISRDKDNIPITKTEAYYLTGILNLPIINKYFKSTYSERSYSINFDIRIPKYKGNKYQKQMVDITKKLIRNSHDADLLNLLQKKYLLLLKLDKSENSL